MQDGDPHRVLARNAACHQCRRRKLVRDWASTSLPLTSTSTPAFSSSPNEADPTPRCRGRRVCEAAVLTGTRNAMRCVPPVATAASPVNEDRSSMSRQSHVPGTKYVTHLHGRFGNERTRDAKCTSWRLPRTASSSLGRISSSLPLSSSSSRSSRNPARLSRMDPSRSQRSRRATRTTMTTCVSAAGVQTGDPTEGSYADTSKTRSHTTRRQSSLSRSTVLA